MPDTMIMSSQTVGNAVRIRQRKHTGVRFRIVQSKWNNTFGTSKRSVLARNYKEYGGLSRFNQIKIVELTIPSVTVMSAAVRPEQLHGARLARPNVIELSFADGKVARLATHRLGMPVDRIRWGTLEASETGESMTVTSTNGDSISIDSSTLRFLVDPKYAAEISKALNAIQFTEDELRELSRPLAGWTGEPENVPNAPRT
jgi:hypothetical protein